MSQARTCTAQTRGECINQKATTPPHILHRTVNKIIVLTKDIHVHVYNAQKGSISQF